jgi:energy-coupling factor transport system permease protein
VAWLCYTALVQVLHGIALLLLGAMVLLCALKICSARLLILLRRTRWILFSLLLIYAYATPGEAVWAQGEAYSPTLEGLQDGFLQLGRLVCTLAGLAILLMRLTQNQLIEGLFVLLAPLQKIGFPRERVAVRLALTLRYAESAMTETARDWRGSIENLLAPVVIEPCHLTLQCVPVRRLDVLLISFCIVCLIGVWL